MKFKIPSIVWVFLSAMPAVFLFEVTQTEPPQWLIGMVALIFTFSIVHDIMGKEKNQNPNDEDETK